MVNMHTNVRVLRVKGPKCWNLDENPCLRCFENFACFLTGGHSFLRHWHAS